MKAQDLMTAPVVTVAPEAPVPEIATLLIERQISAVPAGQTGCPASSPTGIRRQGLMRRSDPDLARAVEERLSREAWVDLRRMNIVVAVGRSRWRRRKSPASSASRITSRPTGSRTTPAELSPAWGQPAFYHPLSRRGIRAGAARAGRSAS